MVVVVEKREGEGVMKYETRIVGVVIAPSGSKLYSEMVTKVEIVDEAAGEYVRVSQEQGGRFDGDVSLLISPGAEWLQLRSAIDDMAAKCRQ